MGLDTWFRVRTKEEFEHTSTGVCSGLFGMCPDEDGTFEIGYLRKCWTVTNIFLDNVIKTGQCCENLEVDMSKLGDIEYEVRTLLSYKFDKDSAIIPSTAKVQSKYEDDAVDDWNIKQKLKETKRMIAKVKKLKEKDKDLKLYINYWF